MKTNGVLQSSESNYVFCMYFAIVLGVGTGSLVKLWFLSWNVDFLPRFLKFLPAFCFVLFVVLSVGNSSPESLFKNAEDGNNASKSICLRYVARRTGTLSWVWASVAVDLYCGSPFCDTLGPTVRN